MFFQIKWEIVLPNNVKQNHSLTINNLTIQGLLEVLIVRLYEEKRLHATASIFRSLTLHGSFEVKGLHLQPTSVFKNSIEYERMKDKIKNQVNNQKNYSLPNILIIGESPITIIISKMCLKSFHFNLNRDLL